MTRIDPFDEDKTPVETPNAKKSSGEWQLKIDRTLVPCPDLPCNETCVWCYGSGQISHNTLRFYEAKKAMNKRDTDEMEAVR